MQIVCQFLTISHNYEGNFCNFMTKTNFNKTKVLKKCQFSSWKTSKLHIQLIKLSGYLFAILLIKIHWNLHGGNHHPPLVWVFSESCYLNVFLILFFYDDEMTFRRNIPFCFWVSWEPLCECLQWLTVPTVLTAQCSQWLTVLTVHSAHSGTVQSAHSAQCTVLTVAHLIIMETKFHRIFFFKEKRSQKTTSLGDVGEKIHASRKYGWKVQAGHCNCLWQLWYSPQFDHFGTLSFG